MKKFRKKHPEIPATPEVSIATDLNEYPPGESVDEHANLEAVNAILNEEEIKQQTENL
ncbi:hypothetical protein BpJC7_14940 [Weizmannia acidilactici]|uniref:Uncharacterized protein n=1 Tax=Weizmannia acidilactici TaxID=2607726 RepID=A0A5J4JES2_9BACI|nr:hypothetical protein [Weizmannia acidilactici]GER67034.1 hypothetical protein BpJC4_15050 [Weizmannia acidilactici]GER70191.1 hypothetical protein BpJC7_14940 [Weizmannia acidilactici]GER73249.1 hypothetical protein BpPP18_13160 [Weizmannia acidilactici]